MAHEWEALANDPDIKPLLTREVDGREVRRTYMRHVDRQSEANEVASMDRKLTDPVERRFLQNPGKLAQENARRKANLLAQSPPTDLSAARRDKLAKLEAVTRDFIAENMPTAEAMRHNPPGTVDHNIAWTRKTKPAMLTWKNARILLNPDSDAQDLANFEVYRRANVGTRSLFTDAQIPGQFALSPQAKERYDAIDWSSPDVTAEIQRRIASGEIKVTMRGAPHKAERPEMPVTGACDVEGCVVVYRGNFGPRNLEAHKRKAHGLREAVPA